MVNVLASVVLWLACYVVLWLTSCLCGIMVNVAYVVLWLTCLCGIMVNVLAYVVLWLACSPLWYYG